MIGSVGPLEPAASASVAAIAARRRVLPRRLLAMAFLVSLVLALALSHALSGWGPSPRYSAAEALALAGQAPDSAALGADASAYRVTAASGSVGGFQAANPAQPLRESFSSSGVAVSSGVTHLRLDLSAVGYGRSLHAVSGAIPRAQGNRVTYTHPGLTEWYGNGPRGLEQGFTIARAPAGQAQGPLTLELALSGNAHATLDGGAQSITLTHPGSDALRYAGLTVTDERARTLRSWLSLRSGRLLLHVDAVRARYPILIDPTVETKPASEVASATAQLNGSVNPHGEEVNECKFEYGTTTAYGSSAACSPAPGKGESAVAVSAAVGSLSANTVYHFRISATGPKGTNQGADQTFTTLATSGSAESCTFCEGEETVKAIDGSLSAEASGGKGRLTLGPYGSNIGGGPLPGGAGKYVQVYHSAGATFTKLEFKDCELAGAKTLWWDNPSVGWEAIAEPTAVYKPTPTPCIVLTVTAGSKPSIAELSDPRFRGGPSGAQEYGKCVAAKHGFYTEGACLTVAEKRGKPDYKGKFEWFPAPVACFPQKHGRYADSTCQTPDEKKGKPKGKYERGSNSFTTTGGQVKFEIQAQTSLECEASTSEGQLRAPKIASQAIIYTGCKREINTVPTKCASAGEQPGTIRTLPLETYTYEEGQKYFTVLGGSPIMSFSCGSTTLTLTGAASGELGGDLNAMSSTSDSTFGKSAGQQELVVIEGTGAAIPTTLTSSSVTVAAQATEIKARP